MLELPKNRYFNFATKKMFNKRLVWYYCHVIYFIKTDWQNVSKQAYLFQYIFVIRLIYEML